MFQQVVSALLLEFMLSWFGGVPDPETKNFHAVKNGSTVHAQHLCPKADDIPYGNRGFVLFRQPGFKVDCANSVKLVMQALALSFMMLLRQ